MGLMMMMNKKKRGLSIMTKKTDIIKIGLDLGASRVKASYLDNTGATKDIIFPNRIDPNVEMAKSGIKVECENTACMIGSISGFSNLRKKKINYSNITEIVFAVAYQLKKALNLDANDMTLHINTVLPPQQFMETRKEFKKILSDIDGKKATVSDTEITLHIDKVLVGCEGVALLNILDIDTLSSDATQVLLLDLGSSTIDTIVLSKENNAWNVENAQTFSKGGRHMCDDIATVLNSTYPGLTYEGDKVERHMHFQLDGERHELKEHIDAIDPIVEELLTFLDTIGNVRMYKVILAGGASRLLKDNPMFKDVIKNFTIVPEHLLDCGNSRGALQA